MYRPMEDPTTRVSEPHNGTVVVGNVGDNSVMHLKHNSWLTPHSSATCVEMLGLSRQPMTDRLATHPRNTTVKR